jgi:N-acetylmuramoyl-L-alanine amidase
MITQDAFAKFLRKEDNMLVAIDEGHNVSVLTGVDHGAIGPKGSMEGDNTFAIGEKLVDILHKAGINVLVTGGKSGIGNSGSKEEQLKTRTDAINNTKCDICVSIHNNSEKTGQAQYISVWVQRLDDNKSVSLAKHINKQLITIPWPNAGIKVANFHMNRETNCPSCIIEAGFISNAYQEKRLQDEDIRNRIAQCIALGIMTYRLEANL